VKIPVFYVSNGKNTSNKMFQIFSPFSGAKFEAGTAGGKMPPVSMTLAVNLQLVSTTPVANNRNNISLPTP
jgi:hypothetical protein